MSLQPQPSHDDGPVNYSAPVHEHGEHHVKREQVHHDSTYFSRENTVDTKADALMDVSMDASGNRAPSQTPRAQPISKSVKRMNMPPSGQNPSEASRPSVKPLSHSVTTDSTSKHDVSSFQPVMQTSSNDAYPGMILQPESSPISEEQLAAEIKGIYKGVHTVEGKCIDIDAALARDSKSKLGVEQWQALIALHRTLLYEHHDFLMATQHPSASENLKALATAHCMPARMWKHGIHAFLEVLRHRRPESQDYMLAFVVLAYQMMALLFETVPCFTDTWIECLGDLARYRMAIEDDREMHAVWGGVAARWYTLASDRHPETGRLYHHLGILERPSMRKLASYAKSLTCSSPFLNARDSMATFCTPIVQEEHLSKGNVGSAEAITVTFFALVFLESDISLIEPTAKNGVQLLLDSPTTKTKEFGPQLVLACVSAVFEFGSAHNNLWQGFSTAISEENRTARPSEAALPGSTKASALPSVSTTSAIPQVTAFYFACFNALTRPQNIAQSNHDLLASVHVILAWFHSLHSLGLRSHDPSTQHTISSLLDPDRLSWGGLCLYLNGLCSDTPIDESVFESARQGTFPGSRETEKFVPLAEDYWMRGLLWTHFYLPKDLLPARADEIESPDSGKARLQRVQWLGLWLAFRTKYIRYDVIENKFRAGVPGPLSNVSAKQMDSIASTASRKDLGPWPRDPQPRNHGRETTWAARGPVPTSPTSTSRSSATVSTAEDSDGFTLVPRQKRKPDRSWAKVAAAPPRKARTEHKNVRVADADDVVQ